MVTIALPRLAVERRYGAFPKSIFSGARLNAWSPKLRAAFFIQGHDMIEITIRKVENGYVITETPGQYEDDLCYVARTDKDMIDHVTEFFFGGVLDIAEAPSPEQPEQLSEETMADEIEGTPAPLPVEPMADLSQGDPDLLRNEPDLDATCWTYGSSAPATTD
jgi:hypothetical protein